MNLKDSQNMTFEERVKFVQECKNQWYLLISPLEIQSYGQGSISHHAYDKMENETKKFLDNLIVDVIATANNKDGYESRNIYFRLIFRGDLKELELKGNLEKIIMDNKDRIIAIYRNRTGNIYLNFSQLLEEFEKYHIKFEISDSKRFYVQDNTLTRFRISYYEKEDNDKKPYLKEL